MPYFIHPSIHCFSVQPLVIFFSLCVLSFHIYSYAYGRDKSRQTTILKKSTTSLRLQNMFRSIIDHRQLQVVHDEFEFHLKLQCELTLLHCR